MTDEEDNPLDDPATRAPDYLPGHDSGERSRTASSPGLGRFRQGQVLMGR